MVSILEKVPKPFIYRVDDFADCEAPQPMAFLRTQNGILVELPNEHPDLEFVGRGFLAHHEDAPALAPVSVSLGMLRSVKKDWGSFNDVIIMRVPQSGRPDSAFLTYPFTPIGLRKASQELRIQRPEIRVVQFCVIMETAPVQRGGLTLPASHDYVVVTLLPYGSKFGVLQAHVLRAKPTRKGSRTIYSPASNADWRRAPLALVMGSHPQFEGFMELLAGDRIVSEDMAMPDDAWTALQEWLATDQ